MERKRRRRGERKTHSPLLHFSCHLRQEWQNHVFGRLRWCCPEQLHRGYCGDCPFGKVEIWGDYYAVGSHWGISGLTGASLDMQQPSVMTGGHKQMAWLNQGWSVLLAGCAFVYVPEFTIVFVWLGVREFLYVHWYLCACAVKKQWRDAANLAVKTVWLEALSLTMIESIGADWAGNLVRSTSELCLDLAFM